MMATYFAMRLEKGKLNYNVIIDKYTQLQEDIDIILTADGYKVNADGTVVKGVKGGNE